MTNNVSMHLREELPPNIVKWANLESTINDLFKNFNAWEERNAELVNKFFNETYFRWEESLINKLIEVKPDIKFNDIKDEWINLAILLYDNWMWDFKWCMDKVSNEIKEAFIQEIFNQVQSRYWWTAPYTDFRTECPLVPWDCNVLAYFQKVINYLNDKEWKTWSKKTIEILKKITITNNNLNTRLWTGVQIPTWINLSDPSIPGDSKNSFDVLLSFEVGKEADRTIDIANDISEKLEWLFTNSFPAINTIVWENDEYKYDENKLGDEYHWRLQTINDDANLSDDEKKRQINALRREYYIKYLKTKNIKIWNALEQLYNNDFDYSKIDEPTLQWYLDKVVDIRLRTLSNSWIITSLGLDWSNVDEFADFYKNLAKKSETNIQLWRWLDLTVEKEIIEWKNERLKDIDEFWPKEKAYDTLPIKFKIKKSDVNSLPINMDDRVNLLKYLSRFKTDEEKYIIQWDNVWMIIYLFFVVNSSTRLAKFNSDKQKEVENLFWKANSKEKWLNNDEGDIEWNNSEWSEDWTSEESAEWNESFTAEKFKEQIEKFWPWKFENWSEIWLPVWESELPGWWYQWMKIKISDVNMNKWTFKGTFFWWELRFWSNFEWKSRKFNMDQETLDELKTKSKDWNKVWLQPNPDKSDFNSFKDSLNNKLWTSILAFPVSWVNWNENKFMQIIVDEDWKEKEVEVKYFWASADDKSTYKVEYNPIRRSFTVSSIFNGDEKWKDWKTEKKRFSYKRDMDWNNFLIFFTQKWLVPQTQEESNSAVARQDQEFKMVNGGHWKLNWFSISNIKNVFKSIKWNIKKKMDDYNKAQDEKLEDILVEDRWIYNKLAWVLGFIPSMKAWLWELQQEHYNNRDNQTWKKIEWYLKLFQSDPDFGTTFDQVPPFARILWWKSYKNFIEDLAKPNGPRSKDNIHKAAAILLANIEKWASPYRWLAGEENSGLWVRVLLWDDHYNQFMRDKQKCINDLQNAWKEKDQIQDVLATCEMDYIINNVSWGNWKLKYFGCHEWRWIPGKDGTDYIDNPSKRLLSNQFADKLKWAYKWWFNKTSVEESFGKITHNDFNLAKEDFKRLLKSSRFPGAIANLKKMFMLAKTPEQQSEYQKSFLLYMLSGVLDVNGKKDLRKQTYQRAKTMWFLPGMLAKETNNSQKVATLLDDFCIENKYWKFSDHVKSYFHEWDLKNWKLNIDGLINDLDSRWNVDMMKSFEKYSKSKFPAKVFPENSILKKLQKDVLDSGMENIDTSLLDNPVVANSWWLLSNANVVRDRMAIKDWSFDWKDPDERNNRAEFWKQIATEVHDMNTDSPESVNLVLKQYFSRFGLNSEADRQKAYKRITTAYFRKDKIWQWFKYDYNGKWKQYLDMWIVSMEEIKDIVWYTFQWTVRKDCFSSRKLPSEMEKALIEFQNFFQKAFEKWTLNNPLVIKEAFKSDWIKTEPMLLWSRNLYKDVFTGDSEYEFDTTEIWDDEDAFRDPKKRRKAQKRAFQSWRFINYEIAQIEKSFKNRIPNTSYRVITQDTSSDIETRIQWLNAT